MNMKIAITVALIGFSSLAHGAMSDRCTDVLSNSAMTFANIDYVKQGYTQTNPPPQDVAQGFFITETQNMANIYNKGVTALQAGLTRDEAEKYMYAAIKHADDDLPLKVQKIAKQAAVDSFMCGFDDAAIKM